MDMGKEGIARERTRVIRRERLRTITGEIPRVVIAMALDLAIFRVGLRSSSNRPKS